MITTVSSDQKEILANIRSLYMGDRQFHADLTWGNGAFWKGESQRPPVRMDIDEVNGLSVRADLRQLPFLPHSLESALCDPPFIHAHGKESIIGNRFGSYSSQEKLRVMYFGALMELCLCLIPGGIVAWKVQDIVESGKQVWTHMLLVKRAEEIGFKLEDLFVLARGRPPMVGWNQKVQRHARRTHSYFLVLRAP